MLEPVHEAQSGEEGRYIAAARGGDLAAFNWLVLRYQTRVYNLCLRMLSDPEAAADVTQDAFISAYRAIARFEGVNFRAWLLRIASNACLDRLRVLKRRPTVSLDRATENDGEDDAPLQVADFSPWVDPEMQVLSGEMAALLQAGLDSLPEDQRVALVLVDVQGASYEEAATITGSNLGTVKSRINRGRRKMRDYLREQGVYPPGGELSAAAERSSNDT
jgi:RNA polymerase sigma factor (sigma-70 family)